MGEANLPQFLLNQPPPRRRLPAQQTRFSGMRGGGGGEIVEVQGGHIVRATGRKDRHSKVCTAKGPRDRRVRLSAHTAIQFYDVQDRLGYDRPSKAVDWLIMNAKAAIDELAELPAWHPTTTTYPNPNPNPNQPPQDELQSPGDSGKRPMALAEPLVSVAFGFGGGSSSNSFLPPSLDSDAIADTIKSFFPMAAAASATAPSSSAPIGYQNFPPDLLSRTSSQDLRLSLQSFQDPIFHHPHHQNHMGFDAASSGWSDHNQRMVPWNLAESGGGSGGFMFNVPPPQALPLHPGLSQAHLFTQRGPLQSSSSPSVRAWADPMPPATNHPMQLELHPLVASIGFASGSSGFSGFRIPARIQGEEEHDDGMSDKPSSASSASHH